MDSISSQLYQLASFDSLCSHSVCFSWSLLQSSKACMKIQKDQIAFILAIMKNPRKKKKTYLIFNKYHIKSAIHQNSLYRTGGMLSKLAIVFDLNFYSIFCARSCISYDDERLHFLLCCSAFGDPSMEEFCSWISSIQFWPKIRCYFFGWYSC